MDNKEKSFLGKGWSFPPAFDKKLGSVEMVSMEEDRFIDAVNNAFVSLLV